MSFIFHVHPISHLNDDLQDRHNKKEDNCERWVHFTRCTYSSKSNQGEHNREDEGNNMLLLAFVLMPTLRVV